MKLKIFTSVKRKVLFSHHFPILCDDGKEKKNKQKIIDGEEYGKEKKRRARESAIDDENSEPQTN